MKEPNAYVLKSRIRERIDQLTKERGELLSRLRELQARADALSEAASELRSIDLEAKELPGCPHCHAEAMRCTSDHK